MLKIGLSGVAIVMQRDSLGRHFGGSTRPASSMKSKNLSGSSEEAVARWPRQLLQSPRLGCASSCWNTTSLSMWLCVGGSFG
eukprot:scaffold58790_cov65-Phaeocystis_antarctica.AAC.11